MIARRLFEDPSFDFVARGALGHAAQGNIDLGLVWEVLLGIPDGDADAWLTRWHSTGERLELQADDAAASGRPSTAGWLHLAASECFDNALAFIDATSDPSRLGPIFEQQLGAWHAFLASGGGAHVRLELPYDGGTLPAVLLRPDATGAPRPTLIVTNGSDGSQTSLYAVIGSGALRRGWNVLLFDGPGQQSMLFERGIPFRPDWEAVLSPVVDAVETRADVDAARLLAFGISQGGYWLPRALAYEHRFVAAAVDGGVMDVGSAWRAALPQPALDLLDAGDATRFDAALAQGSSDPDRAREFAFRAKPFGAMSPFALFSAVSRYRLGDLVSRIRTPLLVVDPEGEETWPGQPRAMYEALTGPKEILHVTREDGGEGHCEPMARGLVEHRVLDFLAAHLPG